MTSRVNKHICLLTNLFLFLQSSSLLSFYERLCVAQTTKTRPLFCKNKDRLPRAKLEKGRTFFVGEKESAL